MKLGLQTLPITFLRRKKWMETEMRVMLNKNKVTQYAREKKSGSHFPAPVAFVDAEENYWVGDGFHRIEADFANGKTEVQAVVKPGAAKDAVLFNLKANRENQGLGFAPGDITKACKHLLTSKDFKGWTRFQISKAVGCTYSMVSKVALKIGLPRCKTGVRPVVEPEKVAFMLSKGMNHKQVADKLGVSVRSIYRREVSSRFINCPHCNGTGRVLA